MTIEQQRRDEFPDLLRIALDPEVGRARQSIKHPRIETDEFGISIAARPCHVHDYHATILHLMGIAHKKLTYRYAGRDFRLTDVHGNVLKEVLA